MFYIETNKTINELYFEIFNQNKQELIQSETMN